MERGHGKRAVPIRPFRVFLWLFRQKGLRKDQKGHMEGLKSGDNLSISIRDGQGENRKFTERVYGTKSRATANQAPGPESVWDATSGSRGSQTGPSPPETRGTPDRHTCEQREATCFSSCCDLQLRATHPRPRPVSEGTNTARFRTDPHRQRVER